MTRLLLSFVAAVFSLTSVAKADVLEKPADIIQAAKAGRSGAWLDTKALRRCLEADAATDSLGKRVAVLKDECKAYNEEALHLTVALTDLRATADLKSQQLTLSESANHKLSEELNAWYHDPLIIGLIGVVVGGTAATTIFVLARR